MVTWSIQGHGSLTPCDSDKDKLNRMDGEWMDAECGLQSQKASYLGGRGVVFFAIFQGIAQSGFETHEKIVVTHLNGPEQQTAKTLDFFRGANTCW